jgi:hypothetical protein
MMGLTYQDAERCGIAHLWPKPGDATPAGEGAKVRGKVTGKNALGQNKSEARFFRRLEDLKRAGVIREFIWEPFKLRLAGNTGYNLDFMAVRNDGSLVGLEVKGFLRDDAAVKVKVAAEMHLWLTFYVVRWEGGGWTYSHVGRGGISRVPTAEADVFAV